MKKIHEAIQAINPSTNVALKCLEGDSDNIDNITFEWNGDTPISKTDIQTKITEMETAEANEKQAKEDLKASAKAKLVAGEALTQEEADTIVL